MENSLDELKKKWKGLDSLPCPPVMTGDAALRAASGAQLSRRRYVLRTYRALSIVSAVWAILGPLMFTHIGLPLWVSIASAVYFLVAFVISYTVYIRVRDIDFGRMSTLDLLSAVNGVIRLRRRLQLVMIFLMIPFLVALFCEFSHSTPMLLGAITGGVAGGIIAIIKDHAIRRNLRALRDELRSFYES